MATNIPGGGTNVLFGGCPSTMSRIRARACLLDYTVLSKEESELLSVPPNDNYYPSLEIL
eukprot:CAMPEP_0171309272 /NCGR_PEP_ID=MMETSP0816-20121228/19445_1 /TAXON_ID=420281 /ORGANISM="Proboscia inermis, Strain CCAP1064/1" /LENGTH=59 /DNA_ID=CAMNT_0011792713 /DNA_START=355 /DNA_END=531 /DNA_ORIENTATION=+